MPENVFYNGKVVHFNNKWLYSRPGYRTLRFKFTNPNYTPSTGNTSAAGIWIPINPDEGIWDWFADWTPSYNSIAYQFSDRLVESVLGQGNYVYVIDSGDFSDIENADGLFCLDSIIYDYNPSMLKSVCSINLSNCKYFGQTFQNCNNLLNIDFIDTQSAVNMYGMFDHCLNLSYIPYLNTSNVENFASMFSYCESLEYLPSGLNTQSATDFNTMCYECSKLKLIPLLDTTNVQDMAGAFYDCYKVESGALNLYNQASTQSTPPSNYSDCFTNCGHDTTTGYAELQQIPQAWGGLA